jgi:hypothetical protein
MILVLWELDGGVRRETDVKWATIRERTDGTYAVAYGRDPDLPLSDLVADVGVET